jgi:hypothetical protein
MDGVDKGVSYYFEKNFKDLPMKNRVKLIKTAKSLLETQKASKENASFADGPISLAGGDPNSMMKVKE